MVTIQDPFFASFILLYSRVSLEAQYGFVILYSSHCIRSDVIFLGFPTGDAMDSARKLIFGDKINQLVTKSTVGEHSVKMMPIDFMLPATISHQKLKIVTNICHQYSSPKTFPFELICRVQYLCHNTHSVVSPKYYLSIEIIYRISYLKI